jgi:hypothetical protein
VKKDGKSNAETGQEHLLSHRKARVKKGLQK